MRTVFIIAALLLVGFIVAYFLDAFRPGKQPVLQNTLAPSPGLSPTPPLPSITLPPSTTINMSINPSATPGKAPSPADADFNLLITDVTGSGFSRTVKAEISNCGMGSAQNIIAKVEVFSGGSHVKINGLDYLTLDLGTLGPGAKAWRQVTLKFSLFDGIKLLKNGADIALTVNSDEKTLIFNYSYKP